MTNATHFQISEFLPKLKRIPFIGKALSAFLGAAHVMMVYNDVLKKGEIECQNRKPKSVKSAILK
jgi:hypothetical protein